MSWRHAVGTSLSSDVTVNLASTSWQQLGGTGAVSYGRYWLNCWKKEIIVDANSLASVGRNPVEKCRDRKTALSKLQIFEHHGVLEYIEMLKHEASHILIYPTPYYSLLFWASVTDKTTINPGTDQTIPCCNTAMDKSNPKVMDAAFSDTRDSWCLEESCWTSEWWISDSIPVSVTIAEGNWKLWVLSAAVSKAKHTFWTILRTLVTEQPFLPMQTDRRK